MSLVLLPLPTSSASCLQWFYGGLSLLVAVLLYFKFTEWNRRAGSRVVWSPEDIVLAFALFGVFVMGWARFFAVYRYEGDPAKGSPERVLWWSSFWAEALGASAQMLAMLVHAHSHRVLRATQTKRTHIDLFWLLLGFCTLVAVSMSMGIRSLKVSAFCNAVLPCRFSPPHATRSRSRFGEGCGCCSMMLALLTVWCSSARR